MTSADAVLVPALVGEADVTEAERTVELVVALARAARREIPVRVLMNRIKRTTLARHATTEMDTAGLARLDSSLSDLVAYRGIDLLWPASRERHRPCGGAALIKEVPSLGWLPRKASRKAVTA